MGSLVNSRRINEIVTIGDDIDVKVVRLRRGNVHLAIKAPKTVPVHRKEIYDKIRKGKSGNKGRQA